jgi:hypothetical protein
MSFEAYVGLGAGIFIGLAVLIIVIWKFPKRLKRAYFASKWKQLQQRFPDRAQWGQAIIEADDLLNEALKKKRVKGKNMGERMVEAQKFFTNNDAVWFGHKLRTKIEMNPSVKLDKRDVQKALLGLRQGLKDIGAL